MSEADTLNTNTERNFDHTNTKQLLGVQFASFWAERATATFMFR